MKKIWPKLGVLLNPMHTLKDCTQGSRAQRLANFMHNKQHKWIVFDCAVNWLYIYAILWYFMMFFDTPGSSFKTASDSLYLVACSLSAIGACCSFALAVIYLIAFAFLHKMTADYKT